MPKYRKGERQKSDENNIIPCVVYSSDNTLLA